MAEAGARRPFFRRRKSCPFTGPNAPKSSGHREPPGWQLPGRPQCRDGMSTAASLLASSWPERHARSDSSATATQLADIVDGRSKPVILLGRKWHPPATDHPASITLFVRSSNAAASGFNHVAAEKPAVSTGASVSAGRARPRGGNGPRRCISPRAGDACR